MATPAWTVVSVRDTTHFSDNSRPEPAHLVTFALPDGAQHDVTIPRKEFTPEHVQDVINEHATKLLQVKAMQGPLIPDQDTDLTTIPMDYSNTYGT